MLVFISELIPDIVLSFGILLISKFPLFISIMSFNVGSLLFPDKGTSLSNLNLSNVE